MVCPENRWVTEEMTFKVGTSWGRRTLGSCTQGSFPADGTTAHDPDSKEPGMRPKWQRLRRTLPSRPCRALSGLGLSCLEPRPGGQTPATAWSFDPDSTTGAQSIIFMVQIRDFQKRPQLGTRR